MAQPVYKLWMSKYTESWYTLSKEEQDKHDAKIAEALKSVGGELLMLKVSVWSAEKWLAWGVEKFPSIEAAQQYRSLIISQNGENIAYAARASDRCCLVHHGSPGPCFDSISAALPEP